MGKGFSVWATLKGKDAASGPVVRGLGKIRAAGVQTRNTLGSVASWGGKVFGLGGLGASISVGGLLAGLRSLVDEYGKATDEESKFARRKRISIGALQEWQYVAGREGPSIEQLRGSLQALDERVGQMAAKKGRAYEFLSGLKGGKDVIRDLTKATNSLEAMEVALDVLRKTPANRQAALANKLGLDPSMIMLAMKSKEEIAALRAEARAFGVDTDASGIAAENYKDSTERLDAAMLGLKRTIGQELAPTAEAYFNSMSGWLASNRGEVRSWARNTKDDIEGAVESFRTLGKIAGPWVDVVQWASENPARLYSLVTRGRLAPDTADQRNTASVRAARAAGFSRDELHDAEAQATAEGLPVRDSRGNRAWDVIVNTARRRRQGQNMGLDPRSDENLLAIGAGPNTPRPVFGAPVRRTGGPAAPTSSRATVRVLVEDGRVSVRSVKSEGPMDITADTGVSAIHAGDL